MSRMRIATWNLDRPTKNRVNARQERLDQIARIDADVWVLTETDRTLRIGEYPPVATMRPEPKRYSDSEAYAAIHAKLRLHQVPVETFDSRFAVCAEVPDSPIGPLLVYGSIITYHNDGVMEGTAKRWELHRASCVAHAADWAKFRGAYPNHTLIAAGDFNQALDRVGRYRDAESTRLLWDAFNGADLKCLTASDFVAEGKLKSRHSVDHIAVSKHSMQNLDFSVAAWEGTTADGVKLSDHNGVMVTLTGR